MGEETPGGQEMALKRKGIVAVPGEYKYGENTEIKTAEELKKAAERQPIITLTKGHPVDGMPSAKDIIGTLSQKWNEERQRVEGEFWFHEESIPDSIREKIVNLEPLAISPGFMIDGIEDGVQKGIVYTHMAVLEEEDPRCPLDTCGINLRMDSKEDAARLYRFDQKAELEAPAPPEESKEPEPTPPVEEAAEAPPVEEPEPPAEHKPEVQDEPAPEEAVQEREPEVVIPPSVEVKNDLQKVGKFYEYVPKAYRTKENE